jgi:Zn-dependent peptidase ImmA (M78 family)/DNA-binding XRE family transcriptional regulator
LGGLNGWESEEEMTMAQAHELDPHAIGQRLSAARKARGITQEEAAEFLGVSRPTLSATERGTRLPVPEEIVRLARYYGRSVHEIVGRREGTVELQPHLRAAVPPSRSDLGEIDSAIAEFQRLVDDYRELEHIEGAQLVVEYPSEVHVPRRADLRQFAEDVSERERRRLAVGDQPILELRRALEDCAGLRTFVVGLPSDIAGMYAYVADLGYCIIVNRKHPAERQRWTLAHEYGHFLSERHKPGVDYLCERARKPSGESFCDAFAANFLMPRRPIRQRFYDVARSTGDFKVADLCKLSADYLVSVQAMTLRLEELALVERGTWSTLREKGFKPERLKKELELQVPETGPEAEYPERYKYLAVAAFCKAKITEGQLAGFLRCDRVSAREIVRECVNRPETTSSGGREIIELPFERSLLSESPS